MNPDREFYLRELSNRYNISPRSVSLELHNLEYIGLLQRNIHGKNHFYHINKNHLLYDELKSIIIKTVGIKDIIADQIEPLKAQIIYAFLYGSYADGSFNSESDIDLMIIGEVEPRALSRQLALLNTDLKKEINFTVMSLNEFKYRIRNNDHFINQLMEKKRIFLFGNNNDFERLGKERLAEKT